MISKGEVWAWMIAGLALWEAAVLLCFAVCFALPGRSLGVVLIGKDAQRGKVPKWRRILLHPYLTLVWLIWRVRHTLSQEDPFNEVADGVLVGRHVLRLSEFPHAAHHIADLTAEFDERRLAFANDRTYCCLPCMDNELPEPESLREAAVRLAGAQGVLFVHCANGHGRSASLAACIMIVRDQAATFEEAFEKMRKRRPTVHIHASQMRVLKQTGLEAGAATPGSEASPAESVVGAAALLTKKA